MRSDWSWKRSGCPSASGCRGGNRAATVRERGPRNESRTLCLRRSPRHAPPCGTAVDSCAQGPGKRDLRIRRTWLAHPDRFSLDPALKLGPGPFHAPADRALFGAIGDSAPDRWGRVLMRGAERRRAERERETPRTVKEIDYLLLVDDEARQGALRFADREGGPFLADGDPTKIPPLIELPRLLSASEHVLSDTDSDEDLRLLLAPGSSVGGARPKASVRDRDGHLAIAKFPNQGDEINTELWEAVALTLAAKAGIPVPQWRLETVGGRSV